MEKQKNKIPLVRFPEFNGEWEVKKLGELVDRITTKNKENNSNVCTISAQYGLISQLEYFNKSVSAKNITGYFLLNKNDFAYNKSYSKGYPMGAIKRLKRYDKGVVSTLYICFRNKSELDNSFAEQYYETGNQNKEIHKVAQEGARNHGLLNIGLNDFFSIPINFPTLPEQKKIAHFFTTIDQKINQLQEKKTALELYKKGVMQQIFSQKLRFKDDNGNDFPEWEFIQLREILIEHKKRNKDNKVKEVFSVAKNSGVINQIEHLGRSYSSDDISNYKIVNPFDVVYTKSPTSGFPFGIIKQNRTNRSGVVSVLYAVFKPLNIDLGYLLHQYFTSETKTFNFLIPIVRKGAKNTMNVSNDEFLSVTKIRFTLIEEEQTKIANFLSKIDEKIDNVTQQIEQTKEWKKGLLQRMFV